MEKFRLIHILWVSYYDEITFSRFRCRAAEDVQYRLSWCQPVLKPLNFWYHSDLVSVQTFTRITSHSNSLRLPYRVQPRFTAWQLCVYQQSGKWTPQKIPVWAARVNIGIRCEIAFVCTDNSGNRLPPGLHIAHFRHPLDFAWTGVFQYTHTHCVCVYFSLLSRYIDLFSAAENRTAPIARSKLICYNSITKKRVWHKK